MRHEDDFKEYLQNQNSASASKILETQRNLEDLAGKMTEHVTLPTTPQVNTANKTAEIFEEMSLNIKATMDELQKTADKRAEDEEWKRQGDDLVARLKAAIAEQEKNNPRRK